MSLQGLNLQCLHHPWTDSFQHQPAAKLLEVLTPTPRHQGLMCQHAQIGFRWAGDANISLCVELPGDVAKLIPRVTDLRIGGTLRVILAPLCDTIPCFGAAVISLR